jgi:hypothetical protein
VSDNPQLRAALTYAARGWPVLPCHHPIGSGCSCGHDDCPAPGKHPATRRGLHDASIDPDRIRRWWHQRPDANIAIRTGTASQLIVVDLDPPHGPGNFRRIAAGRLPEDLAVVRTGRGGAHLYFHHVGAPIRNSASRLAPGIDIRGEGGYVIAPPSCHITGTRYGPLPPQHPPDLPNWLHDRLREPERPQPRSTTPWTRSSGRLDQIIDDTVSRIASAPQGTRNTTLNGAAYRLGRLARRAELDPAALHDRLTHAAVSAGLPEREAARTASWGLHAGLRDAGRGHGRTVL